MSTVPGWCGLPSQFFSLCFVGKIPLSVIMTDLKADIDSDLDQNYSLNSNADPKNMQELTVYVSSESRPNHRPGQTHSFAFPPFQVQNLLQNVQDKFQSMSDQIIARIDDMGNRIDDLEKSIADLMTQAGVEGPEK